MRNVLYIVVSLLLLTTYGCGKSDDVRRRNAQRERINTLDSSITSRKPDVQTIIENYLAEAKDSLEWYELYLRHAKYHLNSKTPDSLLPYVERTIAFANTQNPSPRVNGIKAHAYEIKANYYHRHRTNHNEILKLHTTAYEAMMNSDDMEFLPELCANMADTYTQMNDMAKAASWYRRALYLVDSLQLPDIKNVTLYLGLARIYMNLDDYDTSLKYYRECGSFYDRMPVNMQAYYLNNFGNYYYFLGDYDNALKMFLRMKSLLTEYNDYGIDMYTCKINLADVYLNMGRMDDAKTNVEEAERFFTDNKIWMGVYYARSIRIGMAVRQGHPEMVPKIIKDYTHDEPIEDGIVAIHNKYMLEYYTATGDWRSAFENLSRSFSMRDSIADSRQHMRASEIMQRLKEDTLMLHHELEIQKKDAALKTNQTMTIAVIVFAILTFMYVMAYSRKRKLQMEMNMMQLRLDNARNRLSPHFIFNVLNNRISSADEKERNELMTLAKLIRTNLDISRNTYISLYEEIEFVKYYIDIERVMIGDDFTFTVDAPSDDILKYIQIPTMFVQILVENAIKHGLKGKDGPKELAVIITPSDNATDIVVADNGHGFDIRSTSRNSTRTGLDIIRHTIRVINVQISPDDITFYIHNKKNTDGRIIGCESKLHIPRLQTSKECFRQAK